MASSDSTRSQFIDYTYNQLLVYLSGRREGLSTDQLKDIIVARVDRLQKITTESYPPPSDASKKIIENGVVEYPDGIKVNVSDAEKNVVFAISDHFQMDQVDAYTLFRLFLYNEGITDVLDEEDDKEQLIKKIISEITKFYYNERLCIPRTVTALLKCQKEPQDAFNKHAQVILEQIIPDRTDFVIKLMEEVERKSELDLPAFAAKTPRAASSWAKQNAKEQLVLVETLFWLLWDYVPLTGKIISRVYRAAYESNFGYKQSNATSMLDDEGQQILRDLASLWVLITIEVLELESLPGSITELPITREENGPLYADPVYLLQVHELVTSSASVGHMCTILGWAFYLKAVSDAATKMATRPAIYEEFLKEIKVAVALKKGEKEAHVQLTTICLQPESGLFSFMTSMLNSSLFSRTTATRFSSAVSEPNDVAFRALLKGLIMSLLDYGPVEMVPDFDGLINTWVSLFGNGENAMNAGLSKQFWSEDWFSGKSRRALVDSARSRFPIQMRPLLRILRSLAGAPNIITTDPELPMLAGGKSTETRLICANFVYHFFKKLPTYTQVLPPQSRNGPNALYDRMIDRGGPLSASGGTAYTNLRPIVLPGGSTLPQRSVGRLMCPDSSTEPVIVAWQHEHSGFQLLIDVFYDYIKRRHSSGHSLGKPTDTPAKRSDAIQLQLDDIGMDWDEEEETIADALELLLSIMQNNSIQASQLIRSVETEGSRLTTATRGNSPPDLVQLIFMILEDTISRSQRRGAEISARLVTPALGILTTFLSIEEFAVRVWLYLRSSSILFGSEQDLSFESVILSSESTLGRYPMTLALLRLIRTLFEEAISSLLSVQAEQPKMNPLKEEVLLRALHFIHGKIWVQQSSWRYAYIGDRFEIGRSCIALFGRVLETSSAISSAHTFSNLASFVMDVMLYQATSSTITPLIHNIASGRAIIQALDSTNRVEELDRFAALLGDSLRLTRLTLHLKATSNVAEKHTLIEQALCADHSAGSSHTRVNPVDILVFYVSLRNLGVNIPRGAARTLTALCISLSGCVPSPPSLIGFLSDARATMAAVVKILRHPFDDLELRNTLWTFVTVAVEKQPALAVLFVSGQFRIHYSKKKGKDKSLEAADNNEEDIFSSSSKSASAVEAACETLSGWKELWSANPQLLASVMCFLDVVWSRSLEYLTTIEPTKGDKGFWKHIASIAREELGPAPDYISTAEVDTEDGSHSNLHEAISDYAYKTKVKALALRILSSDVAVHLQTGKEKTKELPESYKEFAPLLESEDAFSEAPMEAINSSYDPALYDRLSALLKEAFTPLSLESLQSPGPEGNREFGDNYLLSVPLLRDLLRSFSLNDGDISSLCDQVQLLVYSVNLNMSLARSQMLLVDSWCFLLGNIKSYTRSSPDIRSLLIQSANTISRTISIERRSGDFMTTIHGGRLQFLLSLLEGAWFTSMEDSKQTQNFMSLLENVYGIISSEAFPPGKSFLGAASVPFHRSLLQIVYYCARNCQQIGNTSQNVKAEHRLLMSRTFTAAMMLVIDALRLTFDTARTRLDIELDKDMEFLVAVFQQCTRKGLHTASTAWLTRCQETDVINASLKVLNHIDISGLSDLPLLRSRGQPLYSPQVLAFHMALASVPFTAERLASESVINTYCNNSLSSALSEGLVDVTLPELPGERSPAHKAYCTMLANVCGMVGNLASSQQFVESQIVGFVQRYGQQLSRALSWNNDDSLTHPFLEELELTIELFYLMANSTSSVIRMHPSLVSVLRAFTEISLKLVQQVNYSLTHPKHLTGLLEPVTADERIKLDRETSEGTVTGLTELLDSNKRPIISRVTRRLVRLVTNVILTLNVLGGSEIVLLGDPDEWPTQEAHVVPHSKVTMGEPASIGTLLELGNCALEVLQFLTVDASKAKDEASKTQLYSDLKMTRQALEAVMMYAVTQLVMWLSKQDNEQQPGEMDTDDATQAEAVGHGFSADQSNTKDRRLRRKSLTLADRLRRGMTGEMTGDLQTLVTKTKPAIASTVEILKESDNIDLPEILAAFLEERVAVS